MNYHCDCCANASTTELGESEQDSGYITIRQMKEMEKVVQLNELEEIHFPRNGENKGGGKCRLQGKSRVRE